MKAFYIAVGVGLSVGTSVLAFNPVSVNPGQAYEIIPIETAPVTTQEFLGTLEEYPEMFEFTTSEPMTLRAQLWQRASDEPFGFTLIAVRKDDRSSSVTEVSRVKQNPSEWTPDYDGVLGMRFLKSGVMERRIEPGTYRIEVSTPVNQGSYLLQLGTEPNAVNYFSMLGNIWATQRHFGHWPFRMLLSSYVYYPIGIGIIIYGIYLTRQYRLGKETWVTRYLKRS